MERVSSYLTLSLFVDSTSECKKHSGVLTFWYHKKPFNVKHGKKGWEMRHFYNSSGLLHVFMESACQTVATSNLTMSTKLFFLQHSMVVVNLRNSGNKRIFAITSVLFSNNKNLTALSYVALLHCTKKHCSRKFIIFYGSKWGLRLESKVFN